MELHPQAEQDRLTAEMREHMRASSDLLRQIVASTLPAAELIGEERQLAAQVASERADIERGENQAANACFKRFHATLPVIELGDDKQLVFRNDDLVTLRLIEATAFGGIREHTHYPNGHDFGGGGFSMRVPGFVVGQRTIKTFDEARDSLVEVLFAPALPREERNTRHADLGRSALYFSTGLTSVLTTARALDVLEDLTIEQSRRPIDETNADTYLDKDGRRRLRLDWNCLRRTSSWASDLKSLTRTPRTERGVIRQQRELVEGIRAGGLPINPYWDNRLIDRSSVTKDMMLNYDMAYHCQKLAILIGDVAVFDDGMGSLDEQWRHAS
ncbi:MAG: hypothetical protein JWN38_1249 [Candidatus Saccharibacteria bacterium]|nr:hypothetical protein [Candidatus Saccharibacteria bacterium]